MSDRSSSGSLAEPLTGSWALIADEIPRAEADRAPGHAVAENLNLRILDAAIEGAERRARRIEDDAQTTGVLVRG
jgi:hypothetical protein